MKKIIITLLAFIAVFLSKVKAQENAVRVNIPSLMLGNINADLSFRLSDRFSLHLQGQAKPFDFKVPAPLELIHYPSREIELRKIFKFGLVDHTFNVTLQPGVRFWTKGVYNRGFFVGVNAIASIYRLGGDSVDPFYRKGYSIGAAGSAGYSYELSPFWNIETEVGLGLFMNKFNNVLSSENEVGFFEGKQSDITIFPSRISLSLVYLF